MPHSPNLDRFSYRVFQFAQRQRLLEQRDKILISVSGGVDSISLLRLLTSFKNKLELTLHPVHFNHGLREESVEEEQFVGSLAESLGLPFTLISTKNLKGVKGMQNKARQWRYDHLLRLLKDMNFSKIALGHHLDDLIETQIWRLLRGSTLFSLNPIQARNPPYIRPLLDTPKADLKTYLQSIGQEWKEDRSNASDDYTRNLIRNRIVPELDRCAGGKLAEKLKAINNDSIHLKCLFNEYVPSNLYEQAELAFETIANLNPLFGHELIHRFLLFHHQLELSRATIEKVYQLATSGKGNWRVCLKGGKTLIGKNKSVRIDDSPGSSTFY